MEASFVNSAGARMLPIPAGTFARGCDDGFWQERPCHVVRISSEYYAADMPVTNAQYELFCPEHRRLRVALPWCHGGGGQQAISTDACTGEFTPGPLTAGPKGYPTSMQTRDGTIHVFSSALENKSNYACLLEAQGGA